MIPAAFYMRTSSLTNVGDDKDSFPRQREKCMGFATPHGVEGLKDFYDPGVSGADPVELRPAWLAMEQWLVENGVRTVITENADRLARDLMVQESAVLRLQKLGVTLWTVDGETNMTDTSDPSRIMIRQVLGSMAQYVKNSTVARLKSGRDRKSAELGYGCTAGVRKKRGHRADNPAPIFAAVREIVRRRPAATQAAIVDALAHMGLRTASGGNFNATQVARVIKALGLSRIDGRTFAAKHNPMLMAAD